MKEKKRTLYPIVILGIIGNILIAIVTMRYLVKEHDTTGFAMTLFGFILTISYISDLEKRAGISKKWTGIRVSLVSLGLIISAFYYFYF